MGSRRSEGWGSARLRERGSGENGCWGGRWQRVGMGETYMLSLPVSPGASRYCTTSPGLPAGAANLPVFNETQKNKFYLTYPAAGR